VTFERMESILLIDAFGSAIIQVCDEILKLSKMISRGFG
jgi:hypothetical protein